MRFGHLENNVIIYAKQPVTIEDKIIFTNDPKVMLSVGEKEIIITDKPENEPGYKYIMEYIETETQIIQNWRKEKKTESELKSEYQNLTSHNIRDFYSSAQELKILREYLAYGDEESRKAFEEYNRFIEKTKEKNYEKVYHKKKNENFQDRKRR